MNDCYKNSEGQTVFKSEYFKKRGSCCKSGCLHCPYGFTIKKHGIKFLSYNESKNDFDEVEKSNELSNISSSLLGSAFGKPKEYSKEIGYSMYLKGVLCGVVYISENQVQKLILLSHFSDQGLSRNLIIEQFLKSS